MNKELPTPSVCYDYGNSNADVFDDAVLSVCKLLKEKGLTVKQAQYVLKACDDMILFSSVSL